MRQVSGSGESGDVHYTRTTASIRRHANQESEKQYPKPRRQIKLFNVCVDFAYLCLSACVCIVCDRINAWVNDLLAQPLSSDLVRRSRNLRASDLVRR